MSEIGIWTVEDYTNYKKLLLFHNWIHSPNERVAKKILNEQIENEYEKSWYSEILNIKGKYEIDLEQAKDLSKSQWQKHVTSAIDKKFESELKDEWKKSRFVSNVKRKKYIDELEWKTANVVMKVKLNMIEAKGNYKGNFVKQGICNISDSPKI